MVMIGGQLKERVHNEILRLDELCAWARGLGTVHFLHIGKTGGSAINHAFGNKIQTTTNSFLIKFHNHNTTLRDIPFDDKIAFVLRDPVKRFVSGFYSRMRMGQPRIYIPWRPADRVAFDRYVTPNELAEALSALSEQERSAARCAMRSIGHVRTSYWDWFVDEETVLSRFDRFIWIGRPETLQTDFSQFKKMVSAPSDVCLFNDPVQAHQTTKPFQTVLSGKALSNLSTWYASGYRFLELVNSMDGSRSADNARDI